MNTTTTLHLDAFGVTSLENSALAAVSGGTIPGWLKDLGKRLLNCIVDEADAIVEGFRDGFNDGAQS